MATKTKEEIEKQAESITETVKSIFIQSRDNYTNEEMVSPPTKEPTPEKDNKPKVVMIEWIDVQSIQEGLMYPDEMDFEPVHCFVVGFLVKETEHNYYLAKEYWDGGQCKYIHIIPKNTAIVKIRTMY